MDAKLQAHIPGYQHSADHIGLSPSVLMGAMDYLYLVQQLLENRKILVTNAMGSITLIIWARFILGLNVSFITESLGTIAFGDQNDPHVLISWSSLIPDTASGLDKLGENDDSPQPSIQLLDEDMSIMIESLPDPERWKDIPSDIRYPLLGYGAVCLHRIFNDDLLTRDLDPIYQEFVILITGLAVFISQRIDRNLYFPPFYESTSNINTLQRDTSIEVWRILASSKLLFSGITGGLDNTAINEYVTFLSEGPY